MEETSPDQGARPETAPSEEKKRPWGKIAAIVIVLIVIIAAIAAWRLLPTANRAPEITQSTASTEVAEVGQSISFTAQATDADGDPLTYTWDFGDGQTGTGTAASHSYGLSGRFIGLLTVADGKGGVDTNDVSLLFLTVNLPASGVAQPSNPTPAQCANTCTFAPAVAVLSADRTTTQTGSAVRFNANATWAYVWSWTNSSNYSEGGSFAPTIAGDVSSLVTSFAYSWADGTANTTGTSRAVGQTSHTFSSTGNFFVKLTATLNTAAGPISVSTGYTVRVIAALPPQQVKNPSIFTRVTFGEPSYVDPAVDYETSGGEVLQNVYETLVWYQEGSESVTTLVPRLALEIPTIANGLLSADGLNYTFNLRPNVRFHNNALMTAADVEFSVERALAIHDPDGPSWMIEQILTNYVSAYAYPACDDTNTPAPEFCTVQDWVNAQFASPADVPAHFRAVLPAEALWPATAFTTSLGWDITNTSVGQVDNDTVVFHLTHPYPAFLQIAAYTVMSIVSKAAVMANGGVQWGAHNAWMDRNTAGTGPFKLKAWVPNQIISLERWDQYWRTPAAMKQVNIVKINDIATRELMLLAGDADTATINRDHQFDVMNTDGTPRYATLAIVKDKPTFDVLFFGYNQNIRAAGTPDPLQVPTNFFADIHIRKAFSYSFDYNQFIQNVIFGGGEQLRGPIPRGMAGFNASLPLFSHNAAQAQTELQAAMNPTVPGQSYWQTGFSITLYYNAGNTVREQGCLLLKQGLEALSAPGTISVSVRALDWPVYLATLRAKGLPIFFLGWAPDYADPDDYAFPFLHSRGTFPLRVGYSNATVDAWVSAAASELDPVVREKMYKDLQAPVVTQHVPYLWIYQATNFHVQRSWVQGYYFNPMLSEGYYYSYTKA